MDNSQIKKWKGFLKNSSIDQKIISPLSSSVSRSKPKKYDPKRSVSNSDLNSKIKSINSNNNSASKMNLSSSDIDVPVKQYTKNQNQNLRESLTKLSESDLNKSVNKVSSKNQIQRYTSIAATIQQNQAKLLRKSTQEPGSPSIIIKQLKRLDKKQKIQQQYCIRPAKVLFSLDEEHRYINEELCKIKDQYVRFKEIVISELIKQKRQMQDTVRKIYGKFQQVLKECNMNVINNFNSNNSLQENLKKSQGISSKQKGFSIQGFPYQVISQQKLQPFQTQVSIIRKNSSGTQNKVSGKISFGLESQRLEQCVFDTNVSQQNGNGNDYNNKDKKLFETPNLYKPKYQSSKTQRINIQSNQFKADKNQNSNNANPTNISINNTNIQKTKLTTIKMQLSKPIASRPPKTPSNQNSPSPTKKIALEKYPTQDHYHPQTTTTPNQNKDKILQMNKLRSRSKKQFEKLFQAVNSLKKDIKDLKTMGNSSANLHGHNINNSSSNLDKKNQSPVSNLEFNQQSLKQKQRQVKRFKTQFSPQNGGK